MKISKSILLLFGVLIAFSFFSCNDDNGNRESDSFALLMRGAYNGGVFINDNTEGESVNAMVSNNMVSVQEMPLTYIIKYISNYVDNGNALLKEIGELDYPVYFIPSYISGTDNDILMELTANDICVSREEYPDIHIDIEPGIGYYYPSTELMMFSIYINNISYVIDDEDVSIDGLTPMQLTFELYKK